MTRRYSMAYLTANGLPPLEAIELAARLGFSDISFRLLPAVPGDQPPGLLQDERLAATVKAALAETGLGFSDAEMIRLNDDTDLDRFRPFLERIAWLGARHILVAGDDPERARITDSYGRLCALVAEYGLTADLEFMPWTAIKNIADAMELIKAANHPAAAILFDALHFDRCGSSLDEIAAIPRDKINYVQICDGPRPFDTAGPAMMSLARTARLVPGDGGIDLPAIIKRLPADEPVSVEVPNMALSQTEGIPALVARSLAASRQLCDAS